MDIQEKYKKARPFLKNGDIILFRGNFLLAKAIRFFDSAYYTHIGVVLKVEDRFLILDSNSKGVKPDFLSERMNSYVDFCILSPIRTNAQIDISLNKALERGDHRTKYDFLLLLRIALVKKLGINLTGLGSPKRDICSEFVQFYTDCLNIICYKNDTLITPQDFIRYRNPSELNISFDNSI